MEASSPKLSNEGKDDHENVMMYLIEEKQRAQRTSLARHALPSSEAEELEQNIKVGSFYEVDHSKLSPKSPEQLNSIRVVMVSEKNSHGVSLRFPSVLSLRNHFSEESYGEPEGKKLPSLDEKYVMSSDMAAKVLFRRIPPQEIADRGNFWSFWSPPISLENKKGSCLSQLRFSGMVQWGKRRQVRFLNRHEEFKDNALAGSDLSGDDEKKEEEKKEEDTEVEKEDVEEDLKEEEEEEVEAVKNLRSSKRKVHGNNTSKVEGSKKAKLQKEKQIVNTRSKKKSVMKNSIERWSISRYKLAEENMLKIMKAKGAFFGNPILRPALRNEARKLIGDTGLLDHLLKHMAGKVAPGGADRFRRRHNSDGAMEYWIESADLVNIRKQAGVQDPYWTPPPGWKPGDNPIQDPVSAREIESIKKEMAKLKKNIQELVSKKEDEAAYFMRELNGVKEEMGKMKRDMDKLAVKKPEDLSIVIQPNFTLNVECDDGSSFLLLKKMHLELMNRKLKIEEQLMEISECLGEMEDQMRTLKSGRTLLPELEAPPLPLLMLLQSDKEIISSDQRINKGQKSTTATPKSGSVQREDQFQSGDKATDEDRETRIQRLKSGFRIYRPQGSFLWPNTTTFSQPAVHNYDPLVVPTPPSASSTSAPSGSHSLSPVKPRPVRPTTLCSVSKGSSSSFNASIPHPPKTPNSQNICIFNLNEAPMEHNINDAAMSSVTMVQAEKEQRDERKEQKESSFSCNPRL